MPFSINHIIYSIFAQCFCQLNCTVKLSVRFTCALFVQCVSQFRYYNIIIQSKRFPYCEWQCRCVWGFSVEWIRCGIFFYILIIITNACVLISWGQSKAYKLNCVCQTIQRKVLVLLVIRQLTTYCKQI